MQPPLAAFLEQVLATAQAGLTYSRDPFDIARFEALRAATVTLIASQSELAPDAIGDWIALDSGYPTPKLDVRAFIQNDAGHVLLVQERSDGRWTLPGGFMESGETGEECVLRELMEETGLRGFGPRLLGATLGKSALYDSVLVLGYVLDRWEGVPEPGSDARDLRFFSRDERPDVPFRAHRELLQIYDGLRP